MNSRSFTLSLLIAVIAMFMVYSYIDAREAQYKQTYGNSLPVVVARVDIKALDVIDDSMLQIITVPKKFVQNGHISNIEEVTNTIAAVSILKGEQITKPRITQPGVRTGLAPEIAPGKRAYAIPVNDSQAVSKLIKPGNRVDVLSVISYAPGKIEMQKVKTVLQGVRVLSTGQRVTNQLPLALEKRDEKYRTVNLESRADYRSLTLELEPEEIQKLIFLISSGARIYTVLRNTNDTSLQRIPATELYDVLGEDALEARRYYQKKNGNK